MNNIFIVWLIIVLLGVTSCGSISINTKHGGVTIKKEKPPCVLDSDIECSPKANTSKEQH